MAKKSRPSAPSGRTAPGRARSATKKSSPTPKKRGGKRPGAGRPRKTWLEDYAAVGAPPADPLARESWLGQVLSVALHKVLTDPGIDEETRLTRIRQLSKDLRQQVPHERLWAAEQKILEYEKKMKEPSAPTAGAEGGDLRDAAPDDPAPLSADYRQLRERGGQVRGPADGSPPEPKDGDAR